MRIWQDHRKESFRGLSAGGDLRLCDLMRFRVRELLFNCHSGTYASWHRPLAW